mmetsp:Transcript_18569/g.25738  ORF Transcript_18569/g.25738 Transcript_18569/m.25738 type:complete len:214 (+) Transcript_18569:292-933(+)|eukprot:CAMPEP_0196595216 /NCGR_PEP_ID=MMETSP1081-20130531/80498_1 /TAXON_ID=36882 /ORGANISM="Pyramimonas amylifera, Strain CCMP720" /LENGTH=213 /DNA_ID=CAMNT_0041919719 /DNA_START=289 /DNA_END=930 /DNA_ORIENTATION=+
MSEASHKIQCQAKVRVAEAVLKERESELARERVKLEQAERLLLEVTQAVSEERSEVPSGGLTDEERAAKLLAQTQASLQSKLATRSTLLARRGQLEVQLSEVSRRLKPKPAQPTRAKAAATPQGKLGEALRLIGSLSHALQASLNDSLAAQARLDDRAKALEAREAEVRTKMLAIEEDRIRGQFQVERQTGQRLPTTNMFHVSSSPSWIGNFL